MSSRSDADAACEHREPQKHDETATKVDVIPISKAADPDSSDSEQKDDPATMAASEELRHTRISDKESDQIVHVDIQVEPLAGDKDMGGTEEQDLSPNTERPTTVPDEEMRKRALSPKKKRERDPDEDTKELEGDNLDGSTTEGHAMSSRTTRSGPEKKRPRDTTEDSNERDVKVKSASSGPPSTGSSSEKSKSPETSPNVFGSSNTPGEKPAKSAFAASTFGSLAASSASPFATLGASKPSVFGGSQPSASGFAALGAGKLSGFGAPAATGSSTSTTTLKSSSGNGTGGFGGGFSSTASGFGALAGGGGSVFGSKLTNGFSGGSGPKLSSFAATGNGNVISGAKPAKAFGAPASDAEESEDDDSEVGAGADEDEESKAAEEKKKFKPTKVEDGEEEEVTLLQVRAKLFALASKETGWKERGVGTLKINVPKDCVDLTEEGVAIPASFSTVDLGNRVVRLIMRQENTHRVILNTFIVKAMEFVPKPGSSPPQVMFTAFESEGDGEPKPINMLLKMSEKNNELFKLGIDNIQRALH